MISNRELLEQIEQLNEQNLSLTEELQQIKDMIQQQNNNQNQDTAYGKTDSNGISNIANDFIKLKGMISQLENKMQSYISKNSKNKPLTEEDMINLLLNMMNGMVDWTMDFLSNQKNQSS